MPHPTLAWTQTAPRVIAIAGANSTLAELLVALKEVFDTDSTWWETSAYSAGAYLEVKRRASSSPTGEQATVRVLFFGGSIPNAAAITPGTSANAAVLYAAASVDANTTGPTNAFTAAAPYNTKYITGTYVGQSTSIQGAESPRISLIESEDGFGVWFGDTNTMLTMIFGRLVVDGTTDTLMWCILPMGGFATNTTSYSTLTETSINSPIPPINVSSYQPRGCMWHNTYATARSVGRIILQMGPVPQVFGQNGIASTLIHVPLGESSTSTGQPINFCGYLRQLRLGPQAQHQQPLRIAGVTRALMFGPPLGLSGVGAWFDQVA